MGCARSCSDWLSVVVVVALLLGAVFLFSMTKAEIIEGDESDNKSIADIVVPWWGSVAFGVAFLALLGAVVVIYYGVGAETHAGMRAFSTC